MCVIVFALISGPPGTGKTYVGLKIAKMLLANKDHWMGEGRDSSPILVVCYTNHALDQFLEGIYTFCKADIVRIGGRSNNTTLEPFLLKNIRRKNRENRTRSIALFKGEKDCIHLLQSNKRKIEHVSEKLKSSAAKLVPIMKDEYLGTVISEGHYNSIRKRVSHRHHGKALAIWLGLTTEEQEDEISTLEHSQPVIKLNRIWKELILTDTTPFTREEAFLLTNIHELELHSRARLYAAWVQECVGILENTLETVKQNDDLTAKIRHRINKIRTNIMELEILKAFSLPAQYRTQIAQLYLQSPHPTVTSVEMWLHLDGSKQSMALIEKIIDNASGLRDKEEESIELFEEDRRLDNDDDDFLFAYKSSEVKYGVQTLSVSETEWVSVINNRKIEKQLRQILNRAPKITDKEVAGIDNVWDIPMEKRKELYLYWVMKYRTALKEEVREYEELYRNAVKKYKEVRDLETLDILRRAPVIGMTTTGAAKNRALLQLVKPKILIVEEAAEVLESHIITTLNDNCQHLILIGDHKQLRPNPTVYDLAKNYKLDVSLFERMIINGVPCVTLSEQHRMRPEISLLMRYKNLYPNLKDHYSVFSYESVAGIDGNVWFIDHKEMEEQTGDTTSYSNTHEARFLASLCRYLMQQGYTTEQITILSPYMGQVLKLRKEMPKDDFSGVKITAVDNFQGEESDIVLLSLVRSNYPSEVFSKRNPIGFLKIENRVCVALSRAKKGLFVIGNFSLLASNSEMWQFMTDTMRCRNRLKTFLTLRCQNHPKITIEATIPDDFTKAPDGGCKLSCEFRLQCGHICQRYCHVQDKAHEFYRCIKPCSKTNSCGHKCQKKCFKECNPCVTTVSKSVPMCGHNALMKCYFDPMKWICSAECQTELACGHKCGLKCGDCTLNKKHRQSCEIETEKSWPCGHTVTTKCCMDPNVFPCPEPCKAVLNCKHYCSGTCGKCFEGRIHVSCSKTCNKTLPCGHKCSFPCSEICPPCTRACDWICSHGMKCKNKCSVECQKCAEDCAIKCAHIKCTSLCYETCQNFKCDEPCKKRLECGHPCAGLCGEKCPHLCPVCTPNEFPDPKAKVILLQDCECIISVPRMDCHIEQTSKAENQRIVPMFKCPDCDKPIAHVIRRYINYIKKRRIQIVDKYLTQTGTALERKRETIRLQKKIQGLKTLGLSQREEKLLQTNIAQDSFGNLHNTKRTVEILEELLKLHLETNKENKNSNQNAKYVVSQASKIRQMMMFNRKYVTTQFWNEVQSEIRALKALLYNDAEIKHVSDRQGAGKTLDKTKTISTDPKSRLEVGENIQPRRVKKAAAENDIYYRETHHASDELGIEDTEIDITSDELTV